MTEQPRDTDRAGQATPAPQGSSGPDGQDPVFVVTGSAMAAGGGETSDAAVAVGSVEQPAKVMRIGSMIKGLLEEVRSAPLDEAGRARLAQVHERSLRELEQGLSPELVAELRRITLPFTEDVVPSDAELRIAQAQLVGWLEGLFHGIQTALFAQQVAARAQLEQQGRRALPGGGAQPDAAGPGAAGHGQYL